MKKTQGVCNEREFLTPTVPTYTPPVTIFIDILKTTTVIQSNSTNKKLLVIT